MPALSNALLSVLQQKIHQPPQVLFRRSKKCDLKNEIFLKIFKKNFFPVQPSTSAQHFTN